MKPARGAAAANWALGALAAQLAASFFLYRADPLPGAVLMLACYAMQMWASHLLRCPVALAAAVSGAALSALRLGGLSAGWADDLLLNLLFLLQYLPMQRSFDRMMQAADVSEQTRRLGRIWAVTALIQRGASMMGCLPVLQQQAVLSLQQGGYTALFRVQLGLESLALLAARVSYSGMVRYLWRARVLLREESV